ncbi:MAG TPA: S-layer homology domain-containing protein, partial [Chloroflexia bacterium]|nr:S-layer homology domain-containing protein [Chloroflexia bacterium]
MHHDLTPASQRVPRHGAYVLAGLAALLFIASFAAAPLPTRAGADVGYTDFAFGPARTPTPSSDFQDTGPTAVKPQSKLWFNDGTWWGALLNGATNTYSIYRLDWATQAWTDTGTLIDSRGTAHPDCLWDAAGNTLYIATAVPPGDPGNTAIHVLRYSYNAATRTYILAQDVVPASGGVEAVVLDKDSTGAVWLSYTLDTGPGTRAVYVTHSVAGGGFISPYIIPVAGAANLTSDDLSALIAFNGRVGVMWSNQTDDTMYFAIHPDGAGETAWVGGAAYVGPGYADDHLNLKALNADPAGQVFAIIKTSRNDLPTPDPNDPQLVLLVLPTTGPWFARTVSRVQDQETRPMLLIDTTNRQLYVFATTHSGDVPSAIYFKQSSLNTVVFPEGLGTPFIASSTHPNLNNATSTKQNLTGATDLLVMASDLASGYYMHNVIDLPGGGLTPSPVPTGTVVPSSTPVPSSTARPPTASPTACAVAFSDVHPADYFYTPVTYLACRGVISGYADGTFRPYANTTRSQTAKIVTGAFGLPAYTPPAGAYTFADVPPSHPFFVAVETAAAAAVISGYSCGGVGEPCDPQNRPYFRPYADVTRAQLAKMVVAAAGWPLFSPPDATFSDGPPGSPAYPFVETAACRGLISGYSCGGPGEPCDAQNRPYFRQGSNATRGQIAKIVY